MSLTVKHIELKQANDFVTLNHRHHGRLPCHRFSLGCFDGDKLVGAAIIGRPTTRSIDQYNIVEVRRLCTDGTKNVCSMLYGASRKAAKALGYEKIITYILESELGTSLKASGWKLEYVCKGKSWNSPSRPREDKSPIVPKKMYSAALNIAYLDNANARGGE